MRIEPGPHHDGVRFANGREITLQQLGPGVGATVIDDLTHECFVPKAARTLAEVA